MYHHHRHIGVGERVVGDVGGAIDLTAIPVGDIDRIEVIRGPGGTLWGANAFSGVINIVSARPTPATVELRAQYGNRRSPKADFFASDVWGKVGVAVEGSAFGTDGFPIVRQDERGPIDTKATVDFRTLNGKIDYRALMRESAPEATMNERPAA